jgi:hypothetical protein
MSLAQIRRSVDEIRAFVNSPDHTNDPRMMALAQEYATACREANDRLQRCADHLEKGHRPEAIAIAEAEPDVLELVSVLSFPEVDEWQEIAGGYGWERFQPLKMQVASSISDAYTTERELSGLLRKHRRLAISQALLKDRLAVMRQIAGIDTTTAFWHEDIAEFEKHRVHELRELGRAVVAKQEPAVIDRFLAEYEAEQLSSPVPEDLRRFFATLFVNRCVSRTLVDLGHRVSAAMSRLDTAALRELREEWEAVVRTIASVQPEWQAPQQLRAIVGPAFAYLEQSDEAAQQSLFERDVHVLLQLLANDEPEEQVGAMLVRIQSYGLPIPPRVQAALNEYRFGAAQGRVLKFILAVAFAMAGIVAIIIAYFAMRGSK